MRGTTELTLRGGGFYNSASIVVRLTHPCGTMRLLRGSYLELEVEGGQDPERIVRAEAPDFSEEGPGLIEVAISFEGGVGNTFTTRGVQLRCYVEPALISVEPTCAPISSPTPLLLRARDPTHFFDSADAQEWPLSQWKLQQQKQEW